MFQPLFMCFSLHRRGAPTPGGGGAELKDRPFPPAPRPLCIATRTIKAQYALYVFFTLFGCWGGGGGLPRGPGHNLLMQFSGLGSSKMEISETDLFDTVTIQNDQTSYVKHVLAPLYVFFTLLAVGRGGGGGGLPRGPGHYLLMQLSGLGSSKMEISETDLFGTLTIQNDQISYVKHVLAPLFVFFRLLVVSLLEAKLH